MAQDVFRTPLHSNSAPCETHRFFSHHLLAGLARQEFNAALAHAYQGPRFDVEETGRMYPFDFEAEERAASGIHDHVLQVKNRKDEQRNEGQISEGTHHNSLVLRWSQALLGLARRSLRHKEPAPSPEIQTPECWKFECI